MSKNQTIDTKGERKPETFEWKMTVRAKDIDFMTVDDEMSAGCNCACDCSFISPLPAPPRRPRRRLAQG